MRIDCIKGTGYPFGMIEFWNQIVVMDAEHGECT